MTGNSRCHTVIPVRSLVARHGAQDPLQLPSGPPGTPLADAGTRQFRFLWYCKTSTLSTRTSKGAVHVSSTKAGKLGPPSGTSTLSPSPSAPFARHKTGQHPPLLHCIKCMCPAASMDPSYAGSSEAGIRSSGLRPPQRQPAVANVELQLAALAHYPG